MKITQVTFRVFQFRFFAQIQIIPDAGNFVLKIRNYQKLVFDIRSIITEIFKVLDTY